MLPASGPLGARVPNVRVEVEAVLEAVLAEGAAVLRLLAALDTLVAAQRVLPAVRLAAVRAHQQAAHASS